MVGSLLKSNSNFSGSGAWSTSDSILIVSLTLSAVSPHPFSKPNSLNLLEKFTIPSQPIHGIYEGKTKTKQNKNKKTEITVTSAQNSDIVCLLGVLRCILQQQSGHFEAYPLYPDLNLS